MTAAACAVPLALLLWLGHRTVDLDGDQHFMIVVIAASSAAAAALALFVLGARKGERRAVITGGAFLAMASLLAVHGAATPGLLVGDNSLIAFAGGLTLPAGAVLLLVGAHPSARRPGPVGPLVALLAAAAVAVLLVGALGMAHPHSVARSSLPARRRPARRGPGEKEDGLLGGCSAPAPRREDTATRGCWSSRPASAVCAIHHRATRRHRLPVAEDRAAAERRGDDRRGVRRLRRPRLAPRVPRRLARERALGLLRDESGTAFSPECVAALEPCARARPEAPAPALAARPVPVAA